MKLYLFNPEHDMALASFSPHYKAPAEIIRMREDLAALPVWYADVDGVVGGLSADYVERFFYQCVQNGIAPYGKLVLMQDLVVSERMDKVVSFMPWGWDPALVSFLSKLGVSADYLPAETDLERSRKLSGRQQCVSVLADFKNTSGVCGEARICSTFDEVRDFLESHADVILKAPWSGSGRGLTRTSLATWTTNLEGWVARILRTQGTIMAEPIYNKVIDFAMEFQMSSSHQLSFVGYSLFETDSHGNYKENVLTSNEHIVDKLTHYVSVELLEKVKRQLLVSLKRLLGTDYEGFFGVDMMVCQVEGDSQTDGGGCQTAEGCREPTYLIHPCVEINLRMNMGVVARLIFDRYMDADSVGSYIVEHYSADGEAVENDGMLRELHPARIEGEKMVEGYFPLTPVATSTRYQCYIICQTQK